MSGETAGRDELRERVASAIHDVGCSQRCGTPNLPDYNRADAVLAALDGPPDTPGEGRGPVFDGPGTIALCCGASIGERHNLSCEHVTVEQALAEVRAPAPAARPAPDEGLRAEDGAHRDTLREPPVPDLCPQRCGGTRAVHHVTCALGVAAADPVPGSTT